MPENNNAGLEAIADAIQHIGGAMGRRNDILEEQTRLTREMFASLERYLQSPAAPLTLPKLT